MLIHLTNRSTLPREKRPTPKVFGLDAFLEEEELRKISLPNSIDKHRLYEVLQAIVQRYPVATLKIMSDGIAVVPSKEGFGMRIIQDGRPILTMGSWHDDIFCIETMVRMITIALRGNIRVVDTWLGKRPWRHSVEVRTADGHWHLMNEISYFRISSAWTAAHQEIRAYNKL